MVWDSVTRWLLPPPAALCHLRFESTPTAYLHLRVLLTGRGLTLDSLVYSTASPLQSWWRPSLLFFFYSLAQHFLPSVDLSGWEYFCESDFKIIWSGLVPNAHICHLLKGLTVLHNFLSVLNLALTVQGNYCKGHTFINWNHKNFVGVLIKWGDLRFKWHIESFTNGNTAHLGESRRKITGEWKHQIAPRRGHRECQQFSLLWFRFCQALAMEPRTPCRLGKPSSPELQLQPLLNSRKTFSLEISFATFFFSMRRLAGVNLSRCLPSFGSICPTRNDFIL